MTYDQAIEYLKGLTKFGMNFGLARIKELLRRLGNPQQRLNIIHIGGTNGKGSTTAMLASILKAAGCKTGMFSSPHLHSYTERFVINGEPIKPQKLAELVNFLRPYLDAMVAEGFEHPTEFEVSTALALLYFDQEKTDFVALEVGLGGAIDSTNVVTPRVSVITNVALDHMDYLGHTIEEIATVKAGIIKKGVPVVTAAEGNALKIIEKTAASQNSKVTQVGKDVTWQDLQQSISQGYQEFIIEGQINKYQVKLPLLGKHQQINAATAVAVIELLLDGNGQHIPMAAILEGLQTVRWPARLEVLRSRPTVILDGAHNHAGAIVLKQALMEYFPQQKFIFVLGMLADKERAKVVAELAPLAKQVTVTRSNNPRAGDWAALADYMRKYLKDVYLVQDVGQAVQQAISRATEEDVICVTGSLYMVAEARETLGIHSVT